MHRRPSRVIATRVLIRVFVVLAMLASFTVVSTTAALAALPPAGNPDGTAFVPVEARAVDTSSPDRVVGNGTPGSCTSQAVVNAVALGGIITFNCGPNPVTIDMYATAKVVNDASQRIVIDGGGKVTLNGRNAVRILYMNTCDKAQVWLTSHCNDQQYPQLTVQNLTFINGNSKAETEYDGGGAIWVRGGRFKVVNSRFFNNVCADVGPDVGGGAIRVFDQHNDLPVYVVKSTFGGAPGLGNVCSNGGALSSIGVSWTIINSLLTDNDTTGWGANPAKPGTPGGGNGGAIALDGNTYTLRAIDSVLLRNHARAGGGAIFYVSNNRTGELYIQDSTIVANPSDDFETKAYPGFFIIAKAGFPVVINSVISKEPLFDGLRLSGSDRYRTSVEISREVFDAPSTVDTVFIATGKDYPDALGAAAAAGHLGAPVLLVGDNLPGSVAAELSRLKPSTIYVVGGSSAVSTSLEATLGAYGAVTRLSGNDRYATSVAVSKQVFPSADVVFIATGANFPDALGAAAAAGHLGAPVLLVGDRVPASVAAELQRLGPDTIHIVGGTSVISPSVANQLAAYGTVHRVAGNDRYGTAVQVSKLAHPNANLVDTVFIATGTNFPDALGAAAAAGHLGAPVLLVADVVPASAVSELGRLDPGMTYVVGGPAVVSDWVLTQL